MTAEEAQNIDDTPVEYSASHMEYCMPMLTDSVKPDEMVLIIVC